MTTQTPTGRMEHAEEEGKDFLEDAKGKAGEVGRQAMTEGRHVMDEMRHLAFDQADAQGRRAAGSLRGVANQLGAMAQATTETGMVVDLARNGADRLEGFADHLEQDGVQGVVADIESFARRRPGLFLAAGFGLGLTLARVVRSSDSNGVKQAISETKTSSSSPELTSEPVAYSQPLNDPAWPTDSPLDAAHAAPDRTAQI